MFRLWLPVLLAVLAAPASAEVIAEFDDFVYLRERETVRYRIDLDYGTGSEIDVDLFVRGLLDPPRVRVIDSDFDEVKNVSDRSGDWILDFDFWARSPSNTYWIEVDNHVPWRDNELDVFITVNAAAADGAAAEVRFEKFFIDRESGDDSDHYDCAARAGVNGWPLVALGALAIAAVYFRRRERAGP